MIGAFIFCIEATHGINRAFWGACCKATGVFGSTLGIGTAALLRHTLSVDALELWGWRIPFLMSIIFGIIGIRLRSKLSNHEDDEHETSYLIKDDENNLHNVISPILPVAIVLPQPSAPMSPNSRNININIINYNDENVHWRDQHAITTDETFQQTQHQNMFPPSSSVYMPITDSRKSKSRLCSVFYDSWFNILIAGLVSAFWGVGYYTSFVWLTYFIADPKLIYHNVDGDITGNSQETILSKSDIWVMNFLMNAILVVTFPLFGWFGDCLGSFYNNVDQGIVKMVQIGLLSGMKIDKLSDYKFLISSFIYWVHFIYIFGLMY